MESSASYTHLPLKSLEGLLEIAISNENYKSAHHIKAAMEHILIHSTISFNDSGDMVLIPAFEEVVEYWLNGKVILKESVDGTDVESVRMTKGLLAFENDVRESEIKIEVNLRRA